MLDKAKFSTCRPISEWHFFGLILLVAMTLLNTVSCQRQKPTSASGQKLRIVATTGMIADAVQKIGLDRVSVDGLMGPGVDPHLYKASQGDVEKLSRASLILYNGLNLEGKMADLFVKMAHSRPTYAVTETIARDKLREPPEFQGHYDPHIWFDVGLWREVVLYIGKILGETDPGNAAFFRTNAETYARDLALLDQWVKEQVATIPKNQRLLLTAHDAFGYFGRAYAIEVRGLQGISTVSDVSLKDLQGLVELIVKRQVKAVFVESSVPQRSVEALVKGCKARGHQVKIGGTLFSDAMGDAGTPEGSYIGMVQYNVRTLVQALQ